MNLADHAGSHSYLEDAFLRWILTPAATADILAYLTPQHPVTVAGHTYRLDYLIASQAVRVAVELDGFAFHSDRAAFTYDRLRQNDLTGAGYLVLRFSYEAIRSDTARCVAQLQQILAGDERLRACLIANPVIPTPDMAENPMRSVTPPPRIALPDTYFDQARPRLDRRPLRVCQREALQALTNYYQRGETNAACVMSVGAGKTALGVAAALAFTRRRALIVTPGTVIRGTFDAALDHTAPRNVLYNLPGGPILPGCRPPVTRVLDRDDGPIRAVTRGDLLAADIIVTNFHSLGAGVDEEDLLSKLAPSDIDFIVIDEAHIAASDSYQRLFAHFSAARTLLMSACFSRLDGKPIQADVVYRYRLVDAIADGAAKGLRIHRFEPDTTQTMYEIVWPDGHREEITGRDALLQVITDERRLANITARSYEPIRQVMRVVRRCLDQQAELLYPIKPRVLFAALGERHAEQTARIAEEYGIACGTLHHTMTTASIARTRQRFESDSGDLQGIVQLKMLGQGYDFPAVTVVVPMRPYGSFSEFYQFVGRAIRVINHPALVGRVTPDQQYADLIYHAELGLDDHLETIRAENDMDPAIGQAVNVVATNTFYGTDEFGTSGSNQAERLDAFVLIENGSVGERILHDVERVETRRQERELEALAQRYAVYAAATENPATFDQFIAVIRSSRD